MRWDYVDNVDLDSWNLLGSAVTGNNSEVFLVIYPSWCSNLAREGGEVVERDSQRWDWTTAMFIHVCGDGVHGMLVFLMVQFFRIIVNMW
jgi:hypothetical protein